MIIKINCQIKSSTLSTRRKKRREFWRMANSVRLSP